MAEIPATISWDTDQHRLFWSDFPVCHGHPLVRGRASLTPPAGPLSLVHLEGVRQWKEAFLTSAVLLAVPRAPQGRGRSTVCPL